jgi:HAD superfamily hydrolase (TIGR01549 family)
MIKVVSLDFYDTLFYIPEDVRNFMELEICEVVRDWVEPKVFLAQFRPVWKEMTLGYYSDFFTAVKRMFELCNCHASDSVISEIARIYEKTWRKNLLPLESVIEAINELSKKYRLVLLTNAIGSFEKQALARYNLLNKFSYLIISSEHKARKPERVLFEKIIELTNVLPQEIMHVGDEIEDDIIPAKSLGMKTVLIRSQTNSIGLSKDLQNENLADICINNLKELQNALRVLDG